MAKVDYLQKAKDYAISRGGECLATEYVSAREHLEWKCSNPNHPSWLSGIHIVSRNSWCPKCAKEILASKNILQDGLQQAQTLASNNGGTCLSTEYINSATKMLFKCHNNQHESFYAAFHDIKKGGWCKKCFFENLSINKSLKNGLQLAQALAAKSGGTCLSTEYINNSTKMKWKCSNNKHFSWETTYNQIRKGSWCPECAKLSEDQVFEKCHNKAKLMNGIFLPTTYTHRHSKLKFQCNAGHPAFETTYDNVIHHDTWCPRCAGMFTPEEFLKKAQEKAISKGGKCLSTEYVNGTTKLLWKCSHPEHKPWKATYSGVVNSDKWCKTCSNFIHYKENKIRHLLEYLFDTEFPNTKPKWNINPKTKKLLQLDGYSDILNLAFEFQGLQHYQAIKYFKMDAGTLEYLQFKDKIKKENCINNNVTLLIIDDNDSCHNNQKLFDYVMNVLKQNNIFVSKKIDMLELDKLLDSMTNYQEQALKKAHEYAKSRNGSCLSKVYINNKEKLEWKCNNINHPSWFRNMSLVSSKNWCLHCAREKTI